MSAVTWDGVAVTWDGVAVTWGAEAFDPPNLQAAVVGSTVQLTWDPSPMAT